MKAESFPEWEALFAAYEAIGVDAKLLREAKAEFRAIVRAVRSRDPRRSAEGRRRALEVAEMALRAATRVDSKTRAPARKH